jgi:hypothetical protein
MRLLVINILFFTAICLSKASFGQHDSSLLVLSELPNKYFKEVDKKIDVYSNRITGKTEKTLLKLSRWEKKIQVALEKVNPGAAQRLFGPGRTTFSSMLAKYQSGTGIVEKSKARYDSYRDKLTTSLKYIEAKKTYLDSSILKPLLNASKKAENLELDIANTEAIEKFVKERKKELINETIKYLGKNKYLSKINKESYYYIETLRNYKELFKDPSKAEETAVKLLNEIPGFDKFLKQNGMIASLFGNGGNGNTQDIAGLQNRRSITSLIESKYSGLQNNSRELINQHINDAQNELERLKARGKDLLVKSEATKLDNFKPNPYKSKTFFQRLEFGGNLQFTKSSIAVPKIANIAITIGYNLSSNSIIGFGLNYKLGIGTIDKFNFSNEGIGLRNFIDWKLKGQLFVSGGIEMNHYVSFNSLAQLRDIQKWKTSAVLGLTKKYRINSKIKGSIQLLYDFLHNTKQPWTSPFISRFGYTF